MLDLDRLAAILAATRVCRDELLSLLEDPSVTDPAAMAGGIHLHNAFLHVSRACLDLRQVSGTPPVVGFKPLAGRQTLSVTEFGTSHSASCSIHDIDAARTSK